MTSPVDERDRILMARLIRADEEAFSQFFDLVFPPLEERARHDMAPHAEGLVTATLVGAVRTLDRWRGQMPLVAWVTAMLEEKWGDGGLAGETHLAKAGEVAAAPLSRDRVRSAVHTEWQTVTTRRAQRRVVTSLMFAIVVALVILLFNCPPG